MSDLATLTVRLEAETSQYQQQLAAATKQLQAFQSDVASFAEDVVQKFAAAFTIDKVAEFIAGAIESAASLEKLSQESGVAVEQLSALQAVFAQSGVGQDEMATSLKRLNVAISDAAGNASNKAAFAFQALGISVTNANGSLKTAGELLPEIADAYAKLADGPNKVAINIALLGRSANALIPTLDKGAQGLEELQAAAIASGAALSGDLAKAAEDLESKFIALKQSTTGTFNTEVLQASLPTLNAFADGLAQIAKVVSDSSGIFAAFTNVILKPLGTVLLSLDVGVRDLGAEFISVGQAIGIAAHGDFQEAWKSLTDGIHNVAAINQAGVDATVNLWQSGGRSITETAEQIAKGIDKAFTDAFSSLAKASNQGVSIASLQQLTEGKKKVEDFAASLKVQADSFGKGDAAQTAYKLSTGALGDAIELAHKKVNDLQAQGIDPYTTEAGKAAEATLRLADAAQASSTKLQAEMDTREISNYTDKLQEQFDKMNLGIVAATAYATAHGKLGAALRDTAIDGASATASIIDVSKQIAAAGNEKTLTDLSVEAFELRGRLVQAADAAFALQSKLQLANAGSTNDATLVKQIADTHALVDAQKEFQEQVNLTAQIRADEALQESAINAAVASGQMSELAGQEKINEARLAELAALGDIGAKMTDIANGSGIPTLVTQAKQAQASLNGLAASTNTLANKLRNDFENDAADSFTAFVTGTETASQAWHQFVNSFLSDLIKLQAKSFLENLIGGGGGSGGGGGGFFGALAAAIGGGGGAAATNFAGAGSASALTALEGTGGLAGGGRVKAGQRAIVGEHGAEEWVPDVPGTIVPNSKMSKSGDTIINISVAAPKGTVSRATASQLAAAAGDGISRSQRRHR